MFGIYDLDVCTDLSFEKRLDIYKKCGFSEVAIYLDKNYNKENENYEDIINYAKEIGLKINQVHIDYKISNLICDENTNEYFDYVLGKLKEAEKFNIPYVVAHASKGDNPPKISHLQATKLKTMLEKTSSTLCLENVRSNENLFTLLKLNLPNLKACFDLGHAHAYGDEKEVFEKLKNKIACTHLHDNFGKDDHLILGEGEIDFKSIINELKNTPNISNCLECFPPYGTKLNEEEFTNFVKKCFLSVNK